MLRRSLHTTFSCYVGILDAPAKALIFEKWLNLQRLRDQTRRKRVNEAIHCNAAAI
jgi:hypothetical protein